MHSDRRWPQMPPKSAVRRHTHFRSGRRQTRERIDANGTSAAGPEGLGNSMTAGAAAGVRHRSSAKPRIPPSASAPAIEMGRLRRERDVSAARDGRIGAGNMLVTEPEPVDVDSANARSPSRSLKSRCRILLETPSDDLLERCRQRLL